MLKQTDPHKNYLAYREEIDSEIKKVLNSGWYILGEQVKSFEKNFSNYLNIKNCVGVANGTDAIELALRSINVGYGDKVITVSHTAVATVSAIIRTGAEPLFVDVDEHTFNMDCEHLLEILHEWKGPMPKAIIPVHMYGQPAKIDTILEIAKNFEIPVVEDCAQAHGASLKEKKVGTYGDIGCFSFYPTKNLGAIGDGGMVVTENDQIAKKIKSIRQYGWEKRYISKINGINSRLDELQAAILNVKLKYLENMNSKRREIANIYNHNLEKLDLKLPQINDNETHAFHQYVIQLKERDTLKRFLEKNNIGTSILYPTPIHLQPAYKKANVLAVSLQNTEKIAKNILCLPIYPEMTNKHVNCICDFISEFFS